MSTAAAAFATDWRQHLADRRFWILMIAVPFLAVVMSPPLGAGYALLTVGGERLSPDDGTIGLELGTIAATVMTPLAFIWLRSGATRKRPHRLTVTAAGSRQAVILGRFSADVAVLSLALFVLTIAGVILALQRAGGGPAPILLLGALWAPTLPVLVAAAGFRALFDALPLLRGWLGDALFVILWLGTLSWSVAVATGGEGLLAAPFRDPYGFLSLLANAVGDQPSGGSLTLGVVETKRLTTVTVSAGLTAPDYWPSRMVVAGTGLAATLLAGLVVPAALSGRAIRHTRRIARQTGFRALAPRGGLFSVALLTLIRDRREAVVLLAAAGLAAIVPYAPWGRGLIAVVLVLPLAAAATRHSGEGMRPLSRTAPRGPAERTVAVGAAGLCLAGALHLPALLAGRWSAADLAAMLPVVIGFPLAAALLGSVGASRTVVCVPLFVLAYALLTAG